MLDILRREGIYLWYYFDIQLRQILPYWVLGMVLGSAISVFAKDHIHRLFLAIRGKRLGALGVIPASLLGIALPLCMYGTIPLAASFSESGMEHDWLAAFMMSSILLNSPAHPVQHGPGARGAGHPGGLLRSVRDRRRTVGAVVLQE